MRHFLSVFIGLITGLLLLPAPAFALTSVSDCTDLQNMSNNLSEDYILTADIDCDGVDFTPIGTLGSRFTGSLDGDGYVVTNLVVNKPATQSVGLIGATSNAATIQDIGIESGYMRGDRFVGGLVGYNAGNISRSYSKANVVAENVTADFAEAGGLAGVSDGGTVTDVFATGNVSSENDAGGLFGYLRGTFSNGYATGNVASGASLGGLVGRAELVAVTNAFAVGSIGAGATSSGGLVGSLNGGASVSGGYWNDPVGIPDACYEGGNTGCTSVASNPTVFYSKTQAPLSSWSFPSVWVENEAAYPTLAVFGPGTAVAEASTSGAGWRHRQIRKRYAEIAAGLHSSADDHTDTESPSLRDVGIFHSAAPKAPLPPKLLQTGNSVGIGIEEQERISRLHNRIALLRQPEPEPEVLAAPVSLFQERVCERVVKRFAGNALERVNLRLEKRFGWRCRD